MTKDKVPPSVPFKIRERLDRELKDPEYASFYLNEALLLGDEVVFKVAIGSVIRANGVVKVAKEAGVNRCTVFKTLKPETRTSFTTIHSLLRACGIDLNTRALQKTESAKTKREVRG